MSPLLFFNDHIKLTFHPLSFWAKVNPYTRTPVNAVWLIVFFAVALNLIGIGSTLTIIAIFNITAPALDLSYATVILARNIYSQRIEFRPGPYTLGWLQKPLNAITIVWVFFISVVLLFPTTKPVTSTNMNYAVAVGGVIAMFSLGWWYAGARKYVVISYLDFGLIFEGYTRGHEQKIFCNALLRKMARKLLGLTI